MKLITRKRRNNNVKKISKRNTDHEEQCSLALTYSIGLWLSLENRLQLFFSSLFQWQALPICHQELAFMEYDVAWEYGNLWRDSRTHFRVIENQKEWKHECTVSAGDNVIFWTPVNMPFISLDRCSSKFPYMCKAVWVWATIIITAICLQHFQFLKNANLLTIRTYSFLLLKQI